MKTIDDYEESNTIEVNPKDSGNTRKLTFVEKLVTTVGLIMQTIFSVAMLGMLSHLGASEIVSAIIFGCFIVSVVAAFSYLSNIRTPVKQLSIYAFLGRLWFYGASLFPFLVTMYYRVQ